MCSWITAVLTSAFCWGAADTIFDVILPSEEHDATLPNQDVHKPPPNQHLTHSQTMFLCAATTYLIVSSTTLFKIVLYMLFIDFQGAQYYIASQHQQKSVMDVILLIVCGVFAYFHYHYILKAFEKSSSTVILPFLQFSSIFAFFFSIVQNFLSQRPYLSTKLHLIAYFLILLGGLAPATDGNLAKIFDPKFWNQPFVKYALLSDMSHAIYTNLVSFVGSEQNGAEFNIYANMEFFIYTRVMFVVIFFALLFRNKAVQQEFIQLFSKPKELIIGTVIGELMTLIGYFCSVYAYQCYYQAGVVSASESSLNLVINLFLAFILKRHFNIGKMASLRNLGLKIASCMTISVGLAIASI